MSDQDLTRPTPPEGAGLNSLQLEVEETREHLAQTLDLLFRKFDVRTAVAYHLRTTAIVVASVAVVGAGVLLWRANRGHRV
ncbi:DUF3618 domain-containing protein [Plantibacter sp. VKM Ac-2880]|jgi:hypothetical protein|uniref:DUF3618 domain-containing protein n=1 Tax=unclassified Plantibacter TaxID=2624265 RepID=UPI0006F24119|nr:MULTISPECIES: DUF3618 domain-containing protein [unclassified Plantibacter]KQQ52340.1 hypothetical protein ASF68_08325 [Plantibacter sp. Leaf314]MBF4567891.1 DUF3618 domain-containing protein [Plantibacter sp. VKM Ac-2880]